MQGKSPEVVIGRGSGIHVMKITMTAGWRKHYMKVMEETVNPVRRPEWALKEKPWQPGPM